MKMFNRSCGNCGARVRTGMSMCDECRDSNGVRRVVRRLVSERELRSRQLIDSDPAPHVSYDWRTLGLEAERLEAERLEAERLEAERLELEAEREAERELIARAKAIQAERKHQADLTWAKRVVADESFGRSTPRRESIPASVRHSVWTRDGGQCVECGSNEKLEFDHIIPFADGGSNTERNLQLLCERCNRRKGKSLG
jgi:hypothetical protein